VPTFRRFSYAALLRCIEIERKNPDETARRFPRAIADVLDSFLPKAIAAPPPAEVPVAAPVLDLNQPAAAPPPQQPQAAAIVDPAPVLAPVTATVSAGVRLRDGGAEIEWPQ